MRIGILLASVLVAGSTCLADTVSLNATYNQNPALLENVGIGDPPIINPGTYQAGVYNFTINAYNSGSPSSTPLTLAQVQAAIGGVGSVFQGICIDFTHGVTNGSSADYTVADLTAVGPLQNGVGITAGQALAISYLWDNAPPLTADTATRLQLAVWDVIYDPTNTGTLFAGNTNIAGAQSDAIAAEAWAAANSSATPDVYAMITTEGTQNFAFLVGTSNNHNNMVPLPSSAAAGLVLLAAFGCFRFIGRQTA